jgi:hypothetical protein
MIVNLWGSSQGSRKTREGTYIQEGDDGRFKQLVLEVMHLFRDEFVDAPRHVQPLLEYFNHSTANYLGSPSYGGVENVKGVVAAALQRVQRNPMADNERPTLDVRDEYDVQDLFHALLLLHFSDVRSEEWTPSYAGGSARMDLLLPEIEAVVELKMMRQSLTTKQLGEQLIVDIAKYKTHPTCRTLFCVVYDPEGRVVNPRGVENDLSREHEKLVTRVMIVPK